MSCGFLIFCSVPVYIRGKMSLLHVFEEVVSGTVIVIHQFLKIIRMWNYIGLFKKILGLEPISISETLHGWIVQIIKFLRELWSHNLPVRVIFNEVFPDIDSSSSCVFIEFLSLFSILFQLKRNLIQNIHCPFSCLDHHRHSQDSQIRTSIRLGHDRQYKVLKRYK